MSKKQQHMLRVSKFAPFNSQVGHFINLQIYYLIFFFPFSLSIPYTQLYFCKHFMTTEVKTTG